VTPAAHLARAVELAAQVEQEWAAGHADAAAVLAQMAAAHAAISTAANTRSQP